jgi:hypothetical protein
MMSDIDAKVRAQVLREEAHRDGNFAYEKSVRDELLRRANELDPPEPQIGTPIVWRKFADLGWRHGIIEMGRCTRTSEGAQVPLESIAWKPAQILGPRQVSVTIPRTDEWPNDAAHCEAGITWTGYRNIIRVQRVITRPEAERMEASDDYE